MDTIDNFLLLASISLLSFLLTFLLKEYLLSKKLLVKPDLRSSHKDPKPQGGGLAVILSLCISLTFFLFSNLYTLSQSIKFLLSCVTKIIVLSLLLSVTKFGV